MKKKLIKQIKDNTNPLLTYILGNDVCLDSDEGMVFNSFQNGVLSCMIERDLEFVDVDLKELSVNDLQFILKKIKEINLSFAETPGI